MRPRAEMPVTADGRPVDIMVYAKGAVARLNPGQFYEHYINGVSHYVSEDIRKLMDAGKDEAAWAMFEEYLSIVAPNMRANCNRLRPEQKAQTLEGIYNKGIYLQIPAGSQHINLETMARLREFRRPDKTPLTYHNQVGRLETSRVPVLVAPMQYMVLDKLDHKPMAISGVLRQHHGLPATQNKSTKYLRPSKETPTRVLGEGEVRSGCAVMGGEAVAELRDLSANPEAHRESIRRIARAENPMQVDAVFDRRRDGTGNLQAGRSLQYVRHVDECGGRAVKDVPSRVGWGEDYELADGTVLHLRENEWGQE